MAAFYPPVPAPPSDGITSLSFSPNTKGPEYLLSSSWDGTVRVYETSDLHPSGFIPKACIKVFESGGGARMPPPPGASTFSGLPPVTSSLVDPGHTGILVGTPDNPCSPILTACFPSPQTMTDHLPPTTVFCGTLSGLLHSIDLTTSTVSTIGRHDKAISVVKGSSTLPFLLDGMNNNPLYNCLATTSWDKTMKLWDVRQDGGGSVGSCQTVQLPGKGFSLAFSGHLLLVGTSGRRLLAYDVRYVKNPNASSSAGGSSPSSAVPIGSFEAQILIDRPSPLKYQTRSVSISPDNASFTVSSIEGRIAVDYFPPIITSNPLKHAMAIAAGSASATAPPPLAHSHVPYAFKCHRVSSTVFPVNQVLHLPIPLSRGSTDGESDELSGQILASCGCDGTVSVWHAAEKKRLLTLPTLETSAACVAFSGRRDLPFPEGWTSGGANDVVGRIAVAQSYTFESGEKDHARDEILCRQLYGAEVGI